MISKDTPNTSPYAFKISLIRELLMKIGVNLVRISRDVNMASHELARIGRVHSRTAVWPPSLPPEIARTIANDCNPVSG